MRIHLFSVASIAAFSLLATARPASAQETTYHSCGGSSPASNEVYIYSGTSYGGTCAALYIGFYPFDGTGFGDFGLANDAVSSIKVGSGASARVFVNWQYSGGFTDFIAGTNETSMPTAWVSQVSSIRVTDGARSLTCDDLVSGEFALFTGTGFSGDCVVLHYGNNYNNQNEMGIANDSVSSVRGGPVNGCSPGFGPGYSLTLYENWDEDESLVGVSSGSSNSNLGSVSGHASSVSTTLVCLS